MRGDVNDPVEVTVKLWLDKESLAELAAALTPIISQQIQRDLLFGLQQASASRPDPNGLIAANL